MLKIPIDKILPVTEARANISKLVDDVEKGDVYVLTRGGKPSVVVASVEYIKKMTENGSDEFFKKEENIDVKKDVQKEKNNLPEIKEKSSKEVEEFKEKGKDIVEKSKENNLPEKYENKSTALEMPDGVTEDDPVDKEEKVPVNIKNNN